MPRRKPGRRPKLTISWADVASGRARLRIPPAGQILLLHWAGAPWSDKNPDATLSPLQLEVLFRKERERILHGGSGVGKSVLGGCCGLLEAAIPHSKLAVVAQRFDHVGREWQFTRPLTSWRVNSICKLTYRQLRRLK